VILHFLYIQKDEIFFEIIAATENVIEILVEDVASKYLCKFKSSLGKTLNLYNYKFTFMQMLHFL